MNLLVNTGDEEMPKPLLVLTLLKIISRYQWYISLSILYLLQVPMPVRMPEAEDGMSQGQFSNLTIFICETTMTTTTA